MADMDGFREANNFGFGQTSQFDNFHVKGASNYSWGMKDRLSRIFNPKTGRAVMLAFDHGFIMGPTSGLERIDLNIVPLVQYADCIMCTRGILQTSIPANINKPVCLRSDAGSTILTELNRNVLIDIEDAIRYNASAMESCSLPATANRKPSRQPTWWKLSIWETAMASPSWV